MKQQLIYFIEVFGWGGIETFVSNLCLNINVEKYDIKILTINKITDHFDEILKKRNIDLIVLEPKRIANPIKRFSKGLKSFDKYIMQLRNPIIHFNVSNSVDLLYVEIAKRRNINNRIVHCHNSDATSSFKRFAHYTLKPLLKNNATVKLACSDKAAKWLFSKKTYLKKEYVLVKNSIKTEEYIFNKNIRDFIREKENWNNKFIVGHVGRFNKQKNHRFLIEVFSVISKKRENAYLVLIGEGALEKEIRNLVHEKGLDKKVIFYGTTSEINRILQGMDVFVLPSFYEGLPFVLVESQAASLPSIVSNSITKEVKISPYIKYFSLENKVDEWADFILSFDNMKRENNLENIVNNGFDLKTMVKNLEELYSSLRGEF